MATRRVASTPSFFKRFLASPDTWPVVSCVSVALSAMTYTMINKSLNTNDVGIVPSSWEKKSDPYPFIHDVSEDATRIKEEMEE